MKRLAAAVLALLAFAASADAWETYWLTHGDRGFVSGVPDRAAWRGAQPPLLDATNAVPTNALAYTAPRGLVLTEGLRAWALRTADAAPLTNLYAGASAVYDYTVLPEGCFGFGGAAQSLGTNWDERVIVAPASVCRAMIGASRPRDGYVVPVTLDHDATKRAGDVVALFYERGRGLVARVRLAVSPAVPPASMYAGRAASIEADGYTATKSDAFGTVEAFIPVRLREVSLVYDPALPTRRDRRALVPEDLVHALPTRIPK